MKPGNGNPLQIRMLNTLRSFFEPPITADPERSAAKLGWLVRLRWLALGVQLLSIIPALKFGVLEDRLLVSFLSVVAGLAVLNALTWMNLRRSPPSRPGHVFFHLAVDTIGLSAMLAMTGGAWNPLLPILFVHMGLGALLLEGQLSWLLFALVLGCIATNQIYAHVPPGLLDTQIPAHLLFPAQFTVAGAFFILTAWLSRTLDALQANFLRLSERKTRIDRLRAVGALAAGLSHEFATPLNTAKLKISRLGRREDLAEDKDLRVAAEALERCEEILRRMSGSQLEPEGLGLEPVDIGELVERVCESTRGDPHFGLDFSIRFTAVGRRSRRALVPAIAFSHAILNLLDNARESSPDGSEIEVIVSARVGRVEVAVLDRGSGWPEIVRRHFGEPFITTKPKGVGLGLYYVHNLAEAVGAEFFLEDREEGGAVARISLPAVAPAGEANP